MTLNEHGFYLKVAFDKMQIITKKRKPNMSALDLKLHVTEYNRAFQSLKKISDSYQLAMWEHATNQQENKELSA